MKKILLCVALILCSLSVHAVPYPLTEKPGLVRFEQYVGLLALWRLPTTGVSVFPGSSCVNLTFPTGAVTETSRFMAIYMQAQSLDRAYFVYYEPSTCQILSFGMDA